MSEFTDSRSEEIILAAKARADKEKRAMDKIPSNQPKGADTLTDEQIEKIGTVWFAGISDGLGTKKTIDEIRDALRAIEGSAGTSEPKCSPTLTECPRCKNDIFKCDGMFATPEGAGTMPRIEDKVSALDLGKLLK